MVERPRKLGRAPNRVLPRRSGATIRRVLFLEPELVRREGSRVKTPSAIFAILTLLLCTACHDRSGPAIARNEILRKTQFLFDAVIGKHIARDAEPTAAGFFGVPGGPTRFTRS